MTQELNLSNLNGYRDILYCVFQFLPPEKNVEITRVCKTWYQVADEVAKKQFISKAQNELTALKPKAENFLTMANSKIEDHFPLFQNAKKNWKPLSRQAVHDQTSILIKKYTVFLAGCFTVAPDSPIPKDKKQDLAGKAFAELHYRKGNIICLWCESPGYAEGKTYFPIELFDLKVQENTIVGNKDSGTYCFSLEGEMVELNIVPSVSKVCKSYFLNRDLDRETLPEVKIPRTEAWLAYNTTVSPDEGYIVPDDFYIPRLESKAPALKS
jgi:hypothetical protein